MMEGNNRKLENSSEWNPTIRWGMTIILIFIHIGFVYGCILILSARVCVITGFWIIFNGVLAGIGTGIASHRFFSHRSFKATRSLKIFLLYCQTLSGQLSVDFWVRTHRIHHKFNDTNKDPSNINRGILFAYVGNFCLSRHPDCQREWERVDMKDVESDKDLAFQKENYGMLWTVFTIGIPTIVPVLLWKESLWIAFWMNIFRLAINYSHIGISNSFNHLSGSRPYDAGISATENFLINIFSIGEGSHNYHHTFPQDYKCAEHGGFRHFNLLAMIVNLFSALGLAYDLKETSLEVVGMRRKRTGDGSYVEGKLIA